MFKKLFSTCCMLIALTTHLAHAKERPTLSQAQVQSLINAPTSETFVLLDVRSPEEFQSGHINKATNISHSTLPDKLALLPRNKETLIVTYCRSGRRASVAEQILRANGYTNVWHLKGDMNGWHEAGLPISND